MSKKWMALLALVFVTSACKKEDVGKETQTSSATPATVTATTPDPPVPAMSRSAMRTVTFSDTAAV